MNYLSAEDILVIHSAIIDETGGSHGVRDHAALSLHSKLCRGKQHLARNCIRRYSSKPQCIHATLSFPIRSSMEISARRWQRQMFFSSLTDIILRLQKARSSNSFWQLSRIESHLKRSQTGLMIIHALLKTRDSKLSTILMAKNQCGEIKNY